MVDLSWLVVSVNEGEVSFKLTVSPDMAPDIQVLAYAVLPSETVIANSADFSVQKCFGNKVSVRRRRPPCIISGQYQVSSYEKKRKEKMNFNKMRCFHIKCN